MTPSYDEAGNRKTLTDARGIIATYGYDADGQLVSAAQAPTTGGGGGDSTKQIPLPLWVILSFGLGLGLLSHRLGRQGKHLTVILLCAVVTLFSGLLYSAAAYAPSVLRYYDANGNLDQRTDGSGTTSYGYDGLNRLTSEAGLLKTQSLSYDPNGNRSADGLGGYAYAANGNRQQTAHGQAIATDAAGHVTNDGVYTYVYNQAGQLAQIQQGAATIATYRYDYRGRRTQKQIGATTTIYHYDQQDHRIAESNAATGATTPPSPSSTKAPAPTRSTTWKPTTSTPPERPGTKPATSSGSGTRTPSAIPRPTKTRMATAL